MPCPSICSNLFWTVGIVLNGYKLFWMCPNHFRYGFYVLVFLIWTQPKQIGPVLNNWYSTKVIWAVQNFGPIKGQGISYVLLDLFTHKICTRIDIFWAGPNKIFVYNQKCLDQVELRFFV